MTIEFKLPELGENIEAGDVINILVAVGDTIAVDDPVLEIETDKATLEVPVSVGGVIKEIHVKEGEQAQVGQVILTLEPASINVQAEPEPKPETPEAEPTPSEPEPVTESEPVVEPQPIIEAQPPNPELPQPVVEEKPPPPAPPVVLVQSKTLRQVAPASPSVRRLARELGVDINLVPGTGPRRRISRDDVKNHVRQLNTQRPAAESVAQPATRSMMETPPLPDFSKWGNIECEGMNNIRKATVKQMSLAWATIPHVTQFDKADITDLEKLRKKYAKKVEAAGAKLTVTAIIIKVLASALQQFPKFNASLDAVSQEVIYKKYYHMGVAVDTPRGLIVPVIRDIDTKNIIDISVELGQIAQKARDRKVTLADLQGGSFTITNLGGIGGTNFTPIINYPQVAILGVARGRVEAVFREGQFEPRMMMPLCVSYDHRLIDGADAVRFLRWVALALEEPFLLALEG